MTPTEIREACREIRREAGERADIFGGVDLHTGPFCELRLYPNGVGNKPTIEGVGDTWEQAANDLRAKWAEHRSEHIAATVRRMALAIIEATADQGQCTEAALRVAGFSQRQIDDLGADACATADHYGSKGPFAIVAIPGANAVAAE